jgi:hypothetical protein
VVLETGLIGTAALLTPAGICLVHALKLRQISAGQYRQAAECFILIILIMLAALMMSATESTPLMITSYGGPINFTVLF